MKKMPTLFVRDYDHDKEITEAVTPGCEWVLAGEGIASEKMDGTCCLVQEGKLYKRYDAKQGKKPPENFTPAQSDPDPVTGHWPGWVPVGDGPEDKWYREALALNDGALADGTYELIGPKIQGNPYKLYAHCLTRHGGRPVPHAPYTFKALKAYLEAYPIEGIVWLHPDGRMVKLKRRDFGFSWPVPRE